MYRVQITRDCFHLIRYRVSGTTLCGERLAGRSIPVASRQVCEKCHHIFRTHRLATTAPRVQIKRQTDPELRKLSGKTGVITCVARCGDELDIGLITDSSRENIADEISWKESDLDVLDGDLDWYTSVRQRLDQIPCRPG